jgi:hypothetical protein
MFFCEVAEGKKVYSFHDYGTCFFIVERGSLEMVSSDRSRRKILRSNDGTPTPTQDSENWPCSTTASATAR